MHAETNGREGSSREAMCRTVAALEADNERLRKQLSLLSLLTYRVASSLDLEVVLQEVVDAACQLTDARYGALALVDASGQFQRLFVHGLSDEERGRLGELPHGRGILGLMHRMHGPLRVSDLAKHERFVGFPPGHPAMSTFLGSNIEDEGIVHGHLYLADKTDGHEFATEDAQLLALFAQQAAAAIRNARRFEQEQAARALAEAAEQAVREADARLVRETADLEKLRTDLLGAIAHDSGPRSRPSGRPSASSRTLRLLPTARRRRHCCERSRRARP